jgi:Cysteine-rich secretory protein family
MTTHARSFVALLLAQRVRFAVFGLAVVFLAPLLVTAEDNEVPAAEQRLLELLNQERDTAGLKPFTLDQRLARAARKHTNVMVTSEELSHQFPGEEPLILRLHDESVRSDHDGENIALDSDVESAHVALMNSPLHRANILNPAFTAVGISVLRGAGGLYITEDFASVLPDYSNFEADAVVQQAITDFVRSHALPTPKRKPRPPLAEMACDMAKADKIDARPARAFPGSSSAVAWTATDLKRLPEGLKAILSQPMSSPYSLGLCFATSTSQPSGVYWVIFVTY